MFDIHIEEFYRDSFAVIQALYQAFPKKANVFVEDIAGPDQPDEYGLHSDRFQCCFGTMLWLQQEGYIRYESTLRQEAIDQACLTMKGLAFATTVCLDQGIHDITQQIQSEHAEDPVTSLKGRPNIESLKFIARHGTSSQLALAMQYLMEKYATA